MANTKDMTGWRFGRLLVKKLVGRTRSRSATWECVCDCGCVKTISAHSLRIMNVRSCGCLQRERVKEANTTHGMSSTPTYKVWEGVITRCNTAGNHAHPAYGGRGIGVCDRWLKFENFYEDMGERPDKLTLDRIDPNKGYCKENCRWATWHEQSRNKRATRLHEIDGQSMTLTDWAMQYGLTPAMVSGRVSRGQSLKEVLQLGDLAV